MRYKAIIFDLDGTAIPNRKDGMPSQHLIDLIQDLKNKVFVCAATARPFSICKEVLKSLHLISPCIVSGGTRIIDPVTNKTLWEKNIPDEIVGKIIDTTKLFEYKLFVSNGVDPFLIEKRTKDSERIIYIMSVSKPDVDLLLQELSNISEISAFPVPAYTSGLFDIHVTHKDATKKQALELLLEMLKVNKEDVIGFGDGNNDLPIFAAVGYKVAMGNSTQELKDIADLVAPTAEEDGVAIVLEKLMV